MIGGPVEFEVSGGLIVVILLVLLVPVVVALAVVMVAVRPANLAQCATAVVLTTVGGVSGIACALRYDVELGESVLTGATAIACLVGLTRISGAAAVTRARRASTTVTPTNPRS